MSRCRRGERAFALALAVLASAGGCALAEAAQASVTIGPERIAVETSGARAVVTRAPFGLAFEDPSGHTVLSEVPAGRASFALPPTESRPAAEPAGPALYAPLSFLVGRDDPAVYPQFIDNGDLESVEEGGTEYSAQEVLSAEPQGEGVRLVLSTDDPSGRTLTVTVAPQGSAAIRVSAAPSDAEGVVAMADSFSSSTSEAFHGFGGRHNLLDQHGQTFYNWVDQENFGSPPTETDLAPDGPQAAYYVQSSFISNHGYGFLLDRNELSTWRMDSEEPEAWQVQVAAPQIEYVVATGSMPQAIATLSSFTGRQRVPPAWLGPIFDQEVELGQQPSAYEQRTEQNLNEIIASKLPVSAFRVEGWVYVSHSFLEGLFAKLKAHGIRPLVYFRPFAGDENSGENSKADYESALADHYFATQEDGEVFLFESNYSHPAGLIDFTNPAAVRWWRERIFAALEMGAEGFMLDFGEQVQPGMHFFDGATGAEMHNYYPVLYQRVTREIVEEFEATHPGREIVFYTRSGYTGEPGTAAYESFNFPGDETTDWSQSSGLASLTRDMLNRAIGGAYGYSTDIGGYYAGGTTRELFLRWAEWAALSPIFRLHGALLAEHTPWSLHATAFYKLLSRLHVSAEPLIRALWQQADATGMPVTRPLYLDYPEDPQAAEQDQEWLLGPDVLVAPVVVRKARSRSVYFPSGCWQSPETGVEVNGPRSLTVKASLTQLPFFFACGTEPFTPPGRFGKAL